MAHTHAAVAVHAVTPAVASVQPDIEHARRTARLLAFLKPNLDEETTFNEVIDQMTVEKFTREARGLNHWSEHAPRFLARVVREARCRKLHRRQEAEAVIRRKGREAVHFVRAIVGDKTAAEAIVADTYLELIDGRASAPGFFPALVGNARNYMEAETNRRDKHVSLDDPDFAPGDAEDSGLDESEQASFDPPSHRLSDQDPLDVLIAREHALERERLDPIERKDELEYALSVVRYPGNRGVLKAKWWQESALGALEKERHEARVASLRAQGKRFRLKVAGGSAKSPDR